MDYAKTFERVTEIAGPRLVLRPVARSMTADLLAAVQESERELYRFMPWKNESIDDVLTFIERSERRRAEGMELNLAVVEKERNTLAGGIGLHHLDPFTPRGEVGYWIRSSRTGRGYATEALEALLTFCAEDVKLVRVDAQAAETNLASQRVLGKCGFVEEGYKRKAALCHGVWLNMKLFGRLLAVEGCT